MLTISVYTAVGLGLDKTSLQLPGSELEGTLLASTYYVYIKLWVVPSKKKHI